MDFLMIRERLAKKGRRCAPNPNGSDMHGNCMDGGAHAWLLLGYDREVLT